MQIKLIGARALNPIDAKNIKKHASARFSTRGKTLQIDVGNPWRGKADYVVVSHLHADHIGQIRTAPKTTTIFVPDKSVADYLKRRTIAPIVVFQSRKKKKIGPFTVAAFPVHHSKYTKTFGYRVSAGGKTITWLTDFRNLSGALPYFRKSDLIFIGASCWKRPIAHRNPHRYGHMPILTTLNVFRRNRICPKAIFLVHLGRQLTPIAEKQKILREVFPEYTIEMAHDGIRIVL